MNIKHIDYHLQDEFLNQPGKEKTIRTLDVVKKFNSAFQRHDASILKDIIAENCVMESAMPAPDGFTVEGYEDNFIFWENMINAPDTQFNPEVIDTFGEKAIIQWRFWWGKNPKHSIRGVTLLTIKNEKVAEAKGYVKGELK